MKNGIDNPFKDDGSVVLTEPVHEYEYEKPLKKGKGYKLAGVRDFHGLTISVEHNKGGIRKGVDKDGHEWETKMHYAYGGIRNTKGADGEYVDVYIGDDTDSSLVFIVHQNDPVTHKYDEDKCMIQFSNAGEAKKAYLKQYDRPGFFGSMDQVTVEEFIQMLKDHKGVKLKKSSTITPEQLMKAYNSASTMTVTGTECTFKEFLKPFLEYIQKIGGSGHSFSIVVDPDDSENRKVFGFDGDGADRIDTIKVVTEVKDLEKAKKMGIGTHSKGRIKVAEGKWVDEPKDKKKKSDLDGYTHADIKKEFEKYSADKSFANSGKLFQLTFSNLIVGKDASGSIKITKLENGRQTEATKWFDSAKEATDYVFTNIKAGKYDNVLVRPSKKQVKKSGEALLSLYKVSVMSPKSLLKVSKGLADELEQEGHYVEGQPKIFTAEQVQQGIRVEMEHTDDVEVAKQIAYDHLAENPDYYSYLEGMEEEMERRDNLGKSKQDDKFELVMREFKKGTLHSSDGKIVTNREQALAIAYSESGMSKSRDDMDLEKAKKMPIGTVSHGRKKVAEGKWVQTGSEKKTSKLKSYERVIKVKETTGKMVDEIIDIRDTDDFLVQIYFKKQKKKQAKQEAIKKGFDKLKKLNIKLESDIDKHRKSGESRYDVYVRLVGMDVADIVMQELALRAMKTPLKKSGVKMKMILRKSGDESKFKKYKKALLDFLQGDMKKSRGYSTGTIREWSGKNYKKMANGKWMRVYAGGQKDRGMDQAVKNTIKKIEKATTMEELVDIVRNSQSRFKGAGGYTAEVVKDLMGMARGTKAGKKEKKAEVSEQKKPETGKDLSISDKIKAEYGAREKSAIAKNDVVHTEGNYKVLATDDASQFVVTGKGHTETVMNLSEAKTVAKQLEERDKKEDKDLLASDTGPRMSVEMTKNEPGNKQWTVTQGDKKFRVNKTKNGWRVVDAQATDVSIIGSKFAKSPEEAVKLYQKGSEQRKKNKLTDEDEKKKDVKKSMEGNMEELEKARKMPIGTVSHGMKKVAEGKWVKTGTGDGKKETLSADDKKHGTGVYTKANTEAERISEAEKVIPGAKIKTVSERGVVFSYKGNDYAVNRNGVVNLIETDATKKQKFTPSRNPLSTDIEYDQRVKFVDSLTTMTKYDKTTSTRGKHYTIKKSMPDEILPLSEQLNW